MSTPERLEAWVEAMDRSVLAAKSLVAAVKLFESGGPDVQAAWDAVEKARGAYVAANRREAMKWKAAAGPDAQTEMEGMGTDDPREKGGAEKGAGEIKGRKGPRLLVDRGS